MAGLSVEISREEFAVFHKLRDIFPELRARALGYVGAQGKARLKQQFLSGQEIDLSAYPTDYRGRRTIGYSIDKGAKAVRISSYPMNLFERGRRLRGGGREAGHFAVTRKFKAVMNSSLQSIVDEFDAKYLKQELAKL